MHLAAKDALPAVPLTESAAQIAHGVSYAACGAGALVSTARWSSLEEQVAAFEWAVKNGTWAPMTVTNALVVVSLPHTRLAQGRKVDEKA
jgi:hypothetical protein